MAPNDFHRGSLLSNHTLPVSRERGADDVRKCLDFARENCNTQDFPTGNAADSRSAIFELLLKLTFYPPGAQPRPLLLRSLVVNLLARALLVPRLPRAVRT